MKSWQRLLDDLEPGDRIEIDCGDTAIRGDFDGLFRSEAGKWMIAVKVGKRQELASTREIEGLLVLQRKVI